MSKIELPPEPEPTFLWDRPKYPHFTVDQLRAYREQIVEVCAQICRQKAKEWGAYVPSANWEFRSHGAEECEAAIRNLIEESNNG